MYYTMHLLPAIAVNRLLKSIKSSHQTIKLVVQLKCTKFPCPSDLAVLLSHLS
jgi:hypothetical protein